jgi:hypothetical protein
MALIVDEIAQVTLAGFVWEAFGDGHGHVQVRTDTSLMSLDRHLAPRWQVPWDKDRSLARSPYGLLFIDGPRIQRLDPDGEITPVGSAGALAVADNPGRVLATLDDGFVLGSTGRIARVDRSGASAWPSVRICGSNPTSAVVSGDRLLVLTDSLEYYAWGFLGPALLLDLRDGAQIAELRGERGAAFGDGAFILGLEGYDVFDTWLHGPDGKLLQQWRSYGHYAVDPDQSVRVVERDRRMPTDSHVVRLLRSGSIERGPALQDCQASSPVELDDGTILFMDGGTLMAVDGALAASRPASLLPMPPGEMWRYDAWLALDGDVLFVVVRERSREVPIVYTAHCWSLRVVSR